MRTSILVFALAALLLSVTCAVPCFSLAMANGSFGFSSDELLGGGSYLGVDTRDVTADQLGALQLKDDTWRRSDHGRPGRPCRQSWDQRARRDSQRQWGGSASVEQLRRMIHEIPAGRVVTLG